MSFRALCILTFGLLILAGCAGTRPTAVDRPDLPEGFPYHSLEQIQVILAAQSDTLRALRAKASLSVRTPEQSAGLSAQIQYRRSDSLYMALSPGLGIEAARILVTADSFYVYDRIKKKLVYGPVEEASAFLPIPLTGDDAFRMLLGAQVPENGVAWELDADTSYYYLYDPREHRRFVVDPTFWRVVRYEELNATGELVEEQVFSEFDTFDGVFVPRRILFRRPGEETLVNVYYRDLTLNPSSLSFDFRVSDSAERIRVEDMATTSTN